MSKITILAIETSADETSAAVLQANKQTKLLELKSNVIHSQIHLHQKPGGIVPEVAARAHLPKILPTITLALKNAKLKLKDLNAIAVTAGPGLITSLRIGVDTAKALAFALNIPIIPINHMEGHLLSALIKNLRFLDHDREKLFPAVGLTVSGGHTQIVFIRDFGKYKILGKTLDDAAGEAFDKIAKLLSLPYPGGPAISKLAFHGNPQALNFPRPMLGKKGYNFSFAGLKTAVLYHLRDHPIYSNDFGARADIAASAEQAIVDVLVAKTVRAAKEYKAKTVLLGGGVSANQKLRETLGKEVQKKLPGSKYFIPDLGLSTDNAGMIALAAYFHMQKHNVSRYNQINANPLWSLKSWQ